MEAELILKIKDLFKDDDDSFRNGILDESQNLSRFEILQLAVQLHLCERLDIISDIGSILETKILEALENISNRIEDYTAAD